MIPKLKTIMKGFNEIQHIPFYCEDCNVGLLAQCYFLLAGVLKTQDKKVNQRLNRKKSSNKHILRNQTCLFYQLNK